MMQRRLGLWLSAVVLLAGLVSISIQAQGNRLSPREYRMLSGADVGFRVEGTDPSGKPTGTWMVRIDGQWIETSAMPKRLN